MPGPHAEKTSGARRSWKTTSPTLRKSLYRTILKSEPTCALAVPAAIADRLLDYTISLRASAMHAYPGIVDEANAGAATPGALTDCQAVLWIDQLLTVIDIGNGQFTGIRDVVQIL